ncbi:hypothetical protein NP493_686g01047 [Ridgeia piscesae]|uniref:Multidrug resistance protein 1 n=1 Tax=Ridgeia piscesae TaxID=27915 RepID=A0AAD9KRJ8_RIDPI|nr:hypothetical protein NP493_686g01047 [Ridgeia piscesae]
MFDNIIVLSACSDVDKFQEGISNKIGNFFQSISTFILGFIIGFVYGWKLCLVILAVSPLLVFSGIFMTHLVTGASTNESAAYAKAGAVAEEVISSIRTVAAFGGEQKECDRYRANLIEAKKFGIRMGIISAIGIGLIFFIMFCAYALAFWYGSKLVREGEMTAGNMITVFFSLLIGAFSLGNATPNLQTFGAGRAAAHALWQIIDRKPAIDSSSDEGVQPASIDGNIHFEDVVFTYPSRPGIQVLNGLSLDVAVGQTVALVGASGCGKSTVIQLIQRFYDPLGGAIYIDNQPINELNVRWLRHQIAIVSQEPVLFATTIAENIRYGQDGVGQDDIEKAAVKANAHDFIMKLPKKYETLVGERGAQLSGGQKQRIAIARAVVRDPKILLLDEATSALDTESEAAVQSALDMARKGRTTIVVAHRLSTIRTADLIIGIKDGEAVEKGSHDELMDLRGIYYDLVTRQMKTKDKENDGEEEEGETPAAVAERDVDDTDDVMDNKEPTCRLLSTEEDKCKEAVDVDNLPEASMLRILKLNSPEWPYITGGLATALIMGAQNPCFAIVFSEFLDVFRRPDLDEQKRLSNLYSLMFFVIAVVAGTAMFFQIFLFTVSGQYLTLRLRRTVFRSLLRQEIGYFDDPRRATGALVTRLSTDASAVHGASGVKLASTLQGGVSVIAGVLIGFFYSWELTLAILAFAPFLVMGGSLQVKMMSGNTGRSQSALEGAGQVATESMSSIRTVASLGKEEHFVNEYKKLTDIPYKRSLRMAHVIGLAFSFSQSLIYIVYGVSFYFGAWLIEHRGLQFVDVFKVFGAIVFGAMGMGQASSFVPDYAKAKSAAARIFHIIDRVPEIDAFSTDGLKPQSSTQGAVELQEVQFRYPSRPTVAVLKDMSIVIEPGKTVALVGRSGCGKSTIVQLLERFYDPNQGTLLIDGRRLGDYNLTWLRSQIGLVSQEPVLFNCSIAENIAYGDNSREVSMDEIIEAARQANIHNFIVSLPQVMVPSVQHPQLHCLPASGNGSFCPTSTTSLSPYLRLWFLEDYIHNFFVSLPQGYETNVGDKGVQMSGGQKQRIAIARALVRNPKILLLDEATSALDTESEKIVQDALDRAQQGRTSIVIAHRLSTIQNADCIFFIKHGRIVEMGTHSQLVAKKGAYFELNNSTI